MIRSAGLEEPCASVTDGARHVRGRDDPARPAAARRSLSRRLHDAGLPVTPGRSIGFARALTLVRPVARRQLYWTARAVFVTDPAQVPVFDAVFFSVFGNGAKLEDAVPEDGRAAAAPPDDRPSSERTPSRGDARMGISAPTPGQATRRSDDELELPVARAGDEELLRQRSFDALEPHELAQLYELMSRLQLATPTRRMRRYEKRRRGERVDMRRTLRASLRTAGDPVKLAHRRRRTAHRKLVLLCDISGSMEPYARAYLQFLTAAARSERRGFRVRHEADARHARARLPQPGAARSSAPPPRRPIGRAERESGTRCGSSTTGTDASAWPTAP